MESSQRQPRKLKPRVTYEEAKPLIKGLIDAGNKDPSAGDLFAVVQRGSKTTMQAHIDRYFSEEQPTIRTYELTMPVEAQEFYLRTLGKQVADAVQATEARILKLTGEKEMVIKESSQFETDLEAARGQIEDLREELSEKNGAIGELQKAKKDAEDRVKDIEKAAAEEIDAAKKEAERQIGLAQEETERVRQAADKVRTELAKAELRLEGLPRLEQEIARLQKELKEETEARHKAEQEKAISETRVEELKGYRDEAEALQGELDNARDNLSKAEAKLTGLAAEVDAAKTREGDLVRYRSEAEKLRGELAKDKDLHIKALGELRKEMQATIDEKSRSLEALHKELDTVKSEQVRALTKLVSDNKTEPKEGKPQ